MNQFDPFASPQGEDYRMQYQTNTMHTMQNSNLGNEPPTQPNFMSSLIIDPHVQHTLSQPSPFQDLLLSKHNSVADLVKGQTKSLRDLIQEYLGSVPKTHDMLQQVYPLLMPDQLYEPCKNLFEMANSVPVPVLLGFADQTKTIVVKFTHAVENHDYLPKSKIHILKEITDKLVESETIKKELLKFGGNFEVLGVSVTELCPVELFEALMTLGKNFNQIYVQNFASMIKDVPIILGKCSEIIHSVVRLLNPIDLFTSYFDILDKNRDGKISLEELVDIQSHLEFFRNQRLEKSQIFSQMKSDGQELLSLLSHLNIFENVIQSIKMIDFKTMFQVLNMIKDVVAKWSLDRIQKFIGKLHEALDFFKGYKSTLNKILNPNYSEILGAIVHIFYDEPEFVKVTTVLFKDVTDHCDLAAIVRSFEHIVGFFANDGLFKSYEKCNFIGTILEALQGIFARCHEIYMKIKEMIQLAVRRCTEILKMGEDEVKYVMGKDVEMIWGGLKQLGLSFLKK
jgi:hypothetical protein